MKNMIKTKKSLIALIFIAVLIVTVPPAYAAAPLKLESRTPGDNGTVNGSTGKISLTFNQPVEIFQGELPDVFFMEDRDGDGKGDHAVAGGETGFFPGTLQVSTKDQSKVVININKYLEVNKQYILIVNPNIRVKGSQATSGESDQVFSGIGDFASLTGWSFTVGQPEESNSQETKENQKDTEDKQNEENSDSNQQGTDKETIKSIEEQIIQQIINSKTGDTVNIEITPGLALTAPMLDVLKEKEGVTLLFNSGDYSITLYSDTLKEEYTLDFTFNLDIAFTTGLEDKIKEIKNIQDEEKYLPIEISYNGNLPGPFTITLKNQDSIASQDRLYLYYYNETGNTLQQESEVVNEDGMVSFDITHGSTYLVTDTPMEEPVYQGEVPSPEEKGGVNTIILTAVLIAAAAAMGVGARYVLKNKKSRPQ